MKETNDNTNSRSALPLCPYEESVADVTCDFHIDRAKELLKGPALANESIGGIQCESFDLGPIRVEKSTDDPHGADLILTSMSTQWQEKPVGGDPIEYANTGHLVRLTGPSMTSTEGERMPATPAFLVFRPGQMHDPTGDSVPDVYLALLEQQNSDTKTVWSVDQSVSPVGIWLQPSGPKASEVARSAADIFNDTAVDAATTELQIGGKTVPTDALGVFCELLLEYTVYDAE